MKSSLNKFSQIEFEYRIFFSLGIVALVYTLAATVFYDTSSISAMLGVLFQLKPLHTESSIYLILALVMAGVSLLRMWAGSALTSQTVMSFPVQSNQLIIHGPYKLVRNPIYLADLLAMVGFAFCLPPVGLLIPVLFYVHYSQLIRFEEISFRKNIGKNFRNYLNDTPRLIPSLSSMRNFFRAGEPITITKDGLRHNALYLLFIPGFLVASFTNDFLHVVLIGLPGVLDWAIVHTKIGTSKSKNTKPTPKVFNDILYAQCWEDPATDRKALQIKSTDTVFSITSGGCNVLTLLLDDPKKIIALDLNPYQNFLLELKIAAFKHLSYNELIKFMGITHFSDRHKFYVRLRRDLSSLALKYWDENEKKLNLGIIHCGRYEKYMHLLRYILTLIIGKKVMYKMLQTGQKEIRSKLFQEKWQNSRWKIFTRVLLSRRMMTLFFDKAFFSYLNRSFSFGDHFAQKTRIALTELPVDENYFLRYILTGNHNTSACLPHYLRRENYLTIRDRLDRIEIITDSCINYFTHLPENTITKFNFSNIFEWMAESEYKNVLLNTIRVACPESILIYRNLLVHRERPNQFSSSISSFKQLAHQLRSQDLSFIYNNYVIESIQKDEQKCHIMSQKSRIGNRSVTL